jgi:hypothetical protein
MSEKKMIVLCMLWGKWGEPFGLEYVFRLKNMVERNTSVPFEFACITDRVMKENEHGITWINLPEDVKRWQRNLPKFYMHKPREEWKGKQIMFFDLDTVLVNNIDEFMNYRGRFATLNPFNPKNNDVSTPGGVMSFQQEYSKYLWEAISESPNLWAAQSQSGKERIVMSMLEPKVKWDRWQYLFPGKLVSFKKHVQKSPTYPSGASIIAFHGHPRPHQILNNKIVKKYWR